MRRHSFSARNPLGIPLFSSDSYLRALLVIYLDEFRFGMWEQFSQLQDPSLLCLKSSLPDLVLHSNSKAEKTILRNAYGWNRWKIWARSKIGVVYLPAQPICVALYLRDLLQTAKSPSPIDTAIYSIRWAHSLAGLSSTDDLPIILLLAKPRQPKEPLQPHMLEQLTESHGYTGATPADLRLLFIVLVGYAGYLRISEVLSMKINHIQIMPEGMSIFLPTRKNDQFRAGSTIHIARTGRSTCPVVITERLLEALPLTVCLVCPLSEGLSVFKVIKFSMKHEVYLTLQQKI